MKTGFTLLEVSIVLVIIGLVVGSIMVGGELIAAAAVRAQISQIEKYQSAVNTFRVKYGYLPGDMPDPVASQYGFGARGQFAGEGDGNKLIQGTDGSFGSANDGLAIFTGELGMFWNDLSSAGLIAGRFTAAATATSTPAGAITGTTIDRYIPAAKIGKGNYVYAWSGGWREWWGLYAGCCTPMPDTSDNQNYFGLSALVGQPGFGAAGEGGYETWSNVSLTVAEAYGIDKKMDDGLPQSGSVMALMGSFNYGMSAWAAGNNNMGAFNGSNGGPTTTATAGNTTTCYDNGNTAGIQRYSMGQNNGAGLNCALSFRFQ